MSSTASLRELRNLSAQQWLDRASRTLPRVLCGVLVIAIAWQTVQLTWLLLDRPAQEEFAPEPVAPAVVARTAPKGPDVQAIVNARLFGVAEETQQVAAEAPQTQMNLVLSAVFAAEDPEKGLAIIGDSAQSARVYSVGKAVRPGTKLHAVYPDRVILDRNGRLEALPLPKPTTASVAVNRPTPAPAGSNFAQDVRQLAKSNPAALARVLRPQPVFANGVQRGFRVYPGPDRKLFAELGLQPGDLVLAVNGTPLDDPQRALEIFNTIETSDRVSLTVERNGQSQELSVNTAQISLPEAQSATPEAQDATAAPTPEIRPQQTPEPASAPPPAE